MSGWWHEPDAADLYFFRFNAKNESSANGGEIS